MPLSENEVKELFRGKEKERSTAEFFANNDEDVMLYKALLDEKEINGVPYGKTMKKALKMYFSNSDTTYEKVTPVTKSSTIETQEEHQKKEIDPEKEYIPKNTGYKSFSG